MAASQKHLYELGKVTVFYVPSHKLDDPRYFPQDPKVAATPMPQPRATQMTQRLSGARQRLRPASTSTTAA